MYDWLIYGEVLLKILDNHFLAKDTQGLLSYVFQFI